MSSSEVRTLLIVDDEPEALRGYEAFLATAEPQAPRRTSSRTKDASTSEGPAAGGDTFKLLLADSGEKALELVQAEYKQGFRICGGFFDVKLGPGIDGLSAIRQIHQLDPEIFSVIVTAYQDRSVEEISTLFGEKFKDRWDYLNKPFTRGEIVQKARQMVSSWNKRRELEIAHSKLMQSERLAALGQLARGIGHEFGNILLRIVGKADLALIENDVEKIREHVRVIIAAAGRADTITRSLMSFSRGKTSVRRTTVGELIREALTLMQHEFVNASVSVETDFSVCPEVAADTGALVQVLLNILINAKQSLEKGGGRNRSIHISTGIKPDAHGPGHALITIADNGPGISDEAMPRLFEFGYSTKGEAGNGLGLAISQEIVRAHGGWLIARNRATGGAEFEVAIAR